jgi:hypothetical protein
MMALTMFGPLLALEQPVRPDPLSRFLAASGLAADPGAMSENPELVQHWVPAPITSASDRSHGTTLQIQHTGPVTIRVRRTALGCALTSGLVLLVVFVTLCPDAQAVPSFTRQTGLACTVCHSSPPELTAFGRKFKLDGYTLTDKKPDTTIDGKDLQLS